MPSVFGSSGTSAAVFSIGAMTVPLRARLGLYAILRGFGLGSCHFAALIAAVLAIGPPNYAIAETAAPPSFSCANPTTIEALVCQHPDLAALDRQENALYSTLMNSANPHAQLHYRKAQRVHVQYRNICLHPPAYEPQAPSECIKRAYEVALGELAAEVLFADHDSAINALRQVNPDVVSLYETIYHYATIEDPQARTRETLPFVADIFKTLKSPISKDTLSREGITQPPNAISSDQHFDVFINIAATEVLHSRTPLLLPCAAIIKKPALLPATQGTDATKSTSLRDDCESVLPEVPAFEALRQIAIQAQPDCEGAARLEVGREFTKTLLQLRTHQPVTRITPAARGFVATSAFKTTHLPEIVAAERELANYYETLFGDSHRKAVSTAKWAVDTMIAKTFEIYGACGDLGI